jgi:hypothetical protein
MNDEMNNSATSTINTVDVALVEIANEIWAELVTASTVEAPFMIKPYYNEMIKKEDKSDYKLPSALTVEEYRAIPPKTIWNSGVKFSFYSVNMSQVAPICLCHLLIHTAFKLKIFGADAFNKVTARCKAGANAVNYLLEKNHVFFLVGSGHNRFPSHVCSLNEDIFKTTIQDALKMSVNTNLQRNYVGDGLGDPAITGFGLPRSALTDGSIAGALFKQSLHTSASNPSHILLGASDITAGAMKQMN